MYIYHTAPNLQAANLQAVWNMEAFSISERLGCFCVLPNLVFEAGKYNFSGPGGRLVLKTKPLLCLFWLFKSCLKYLWSILVHPRRSKLLSLGPLFCSPLSISFLHSKAYEESVGNFCRHGTHLPVAKSVFHASLRTSSFLQKKYSPIVNPLSSYNSVMSSSICRVLFFLLALVKHEWKRNKRLRAFRMAGKGRISPTYEYASDY